MSHELTRLIAACDPDIFKRFLIEFSPDKVDAIDWSLSGRDLGRHVERQLGAFGEIALLFEQIGALAEHGGKSIVRSVLYNDRSLRNELGDLDASDETAAVWLAAINSHYFDFALSALHAEQGLNKRSWRAFRVPFTDDVTFDFGEDAQGTFKDMVREVIEKHRTFDSPGRLHVHHFERMVFPEHSHSGRALTQITVYAEMRNVTEDVFNDDDVLETRRRKRTDQISILLDCGRKEVDVVSIGGKHFLQKIAHAFCQSFASETPALEDLIRRPVHLQVLARRPVFALLPADEVKTVYVDEIRLKSPSGWLQTLERKSRTELTADVYDVADNYYGDRSPFRNDGWTVEGARIRLGGEPTKTGRSRKIRTVELKPNGHTNLLEHDSRDRWIANNLFVRWGLLDPEEPDEI